MSDNRIDEDIRHIGYSAIGHYQVLNVMARGSHSTLYLAQQEAPGQRQVAIRLIKPGLDHKEIIASFRSIKQTFALIDHPDIGRIYDTGVTPEGLPYFVTEYVAGQPLTQYCDTQELTIKERLNLFLSLCRTVHYAHLKGILHCALKPSSVRVGLQDGQARMKIIDFGIARILTDQELIENSLHPAEDSPHRLPFYLSPEQAALSAGDIDLRTDIYSLGAILYELLAGMPLFEENEFANLSFMSMLRKIREISPLHPAARLNTQDEKSTLIADKRGTTPNSLEKELQGDLGWIILKALAREKENRYQSVSDLMADIRHYLAGQPVAAHPPSILYQVKNFFRQKKWAALFAVVFSLLLAALFTWNVQARKGAELERARAVELQKEANFELARAQKEQAGALARQNNFQLARLLAIHSLLNQAKAGKYFPLDDIQLPYEFQDWIIAYAMPGLSPRLGLCTPSPYLAAADKEGTVKIWELANQKPLASFGERGEVFHAVSLSPDGRYLAASGKKNVKIWNTYAKKILAEYHIEDGDNREIAFIHFSPNGQYLAIGYPGSTDLWEVALGKVISALPGIPSAPACLAFSPDTKFLAITGPGNTIDILDIPAFTTNRSLNPETEKISALCFGPDGKTLALGGETDILTYDTGTGQRVRTAKAHKGPIRAISFSPNQKYLASASQDGTIKIWELPAFKEISLLKPTDGAVIWVGFSPDSRFLVSTSQDKIIRVWAMAREKEIISPADSQGFMKDPQFDPQGHYLAATDDQTITTWRLPGAQVGLALKIPDNPFTGFCLSPDGKILATAAQNQVKLRDNESGKEIITLKEDLKGVHTLGFNPSGKYLAGSGENASKIWEIQSGREIISFRLRSARPGPLCFSPNGKYLATGDSSGTITIRDLTTLTVTSSLRGHDGPITAIHFSPDGEHLASSAARDMDIRVWNLKDRHALTLEGHTAEVLSLDYSPDGRYLASASADGTIKAWDPKTGIPLTTLKNDAPGPAGINFSPDGRFLASTSTQGLKIWDFHYFFDYLHFNLDAPYQVQDIEKLAKKIELQTGFVLTGVTPSPPLDAYTYYNRGEIHFENREYLQAIQAYKKSLKLDPNSARTWYDLGTAHRFQKEYAASIKALQKALALDPQAHWAWFELGLALKEDRQYKPAAAALQKAAQLKPNSPITWYELGLAFARQKDDKQAIAAYNRAIALKSRFSAAWYDLGRLYDRNKDYDKAGTAFEKALEISPGQAPIWDSLGITLSKKGEYDRGIEAFTKAIQIDPEFEAAYNNMAITYRYKGNLDKAVELHQKALQLNPQYDLGWDALGSTYNARKEYDKAIEAYRKAVTLNPDSWSAWGNLGFIYLKLNDKSSAIDAFEKTVHINPGNFDAWSNLGDLYAEKKDYERSIAAYTQAVKIEKSNHTVWNNLGKSLLLKGDPGKALEQFQQAVKINPRNFAAQFNIALTYLVQQEFEKAFNAYVQVMEQMTPDEQYVTAAIKDIDQLIEEKPDLNFALLIRRFLYQKAGDKEKAMEDLERFVKFIKESKGK